MLNLQARHLFIVLVLAMAMPAAHALEIIFFEDFGCEGDGYDNCGTVETPRPNWTQIGNPDTHRADTNYAGVTQVISSDSSTRVSASGDNPNNFSVTGRNWDIHDGSRNEWVAGYREDSDNVQEHFNENENMSGNMLGHVRANYDHWEDNYYQLDGIVLDNLLTDIQLMFDYDSWISDDVDAFGVAVAANGGGFDLLTPISRSTDPDSDMQYRTVGSSSADQSLNVLLGEPSGNVVGFDGHESGGRMAGTAMFDLSGFAGQTISLRFAFASNNSGSLEEGINIDNIKVTGVCTSGSGPSCDNVPGTGVPEPGSLALAMLGLTALYRRQRKLAA